MSGTNNYVPERKLNSSHSLSPSMQKQITQTVADLQQAPPHPFRLHFIRNRDSQLKLWLPCFNGVHRNLVIIPDLDAALMSVTVNNNDGSNISDKSDWLSSSTSPSPPSSYLSSVQNARFHPIEYVCQHRIIRTGLAPSSPLLQGLHYVGFRHPQ